MAVPKVVMHRRRRLPQRHAPGCRQAWVLGWMAAVLTAATPAGAECTFGPPEWTADGTALRVPVAAAGETRTLRVDAATGVPSLEDPDVHEPMWCAKRGTIVFRDVLGLCELDTTAAAVPRFLLPVTESSPRFLRAAGEDAQGRLIAWLYDRNTGRHTFWRLDSRTGAPTTEDAGSGPEALQAWNKRNIARPFTRAGGRFLRSACVRFRARPERVCLEPVGPEGTARAFRLTLGRPGAMGDWAANLQPTAYTIAPDSGAVIVGAVEVSDPATSTVTTTWVVDAEHARRVATTPGPAPSQPPFNGWVRWLDPSHALWTDAAGALWRVDTSNARAAALIAIPVRRPLRTAFRVVAARTTNRDSAATILKTLTAAGFDAGIQTIGSRYEIQAGAAFTRPESEARAQSVRAHGFPTAQSLAGSTATIAPGVVFGVTLGATGRRAFVRNVAIGTSVSSELWIEDTKGQPHRLVAALDAP